MLLTHMSQSRCHVQVAQTYSFVVCWLCKKTPHSVCAMAGLEGFVTRELATPLASTSQPAGAFQQLLLLLLLLLLLYCYYYTVLIIVVWQTTARTGKTGVCDCNLIRS